MSALIDAIPFAAFVTGVNLNAVADTAITLPNGSRQYVVDRIVVTNCSANISGGTTEYGVYSAASAGGEVIVTNGVNSATGLTATTKFISPTIAHNDRINTSTIYFRVTVAAGTAATADVIVYLRYLPYIG